MARVAPVEQPLELKNGEAEETTKMPPLVYGPAGACRRWYRQHCRTGQKAQAGRPG